MNKNIMDCIAVVRAVLPPMDATQAYRHAVVPIGQSAEQQREFVNSFDAIINVHDVSEIDDIGFKLMQLGHVVAVKPTGAAGFNSVIFDPDSEPCEDHSQLFYIRIVE